MTTDRPASRRDSLKGIAIASVASGVVLAGVSVAGSSGSGAGGDENGAGDDGNGEADGEEGDGSGTASDERSGEGDDETASADRHGDLRLIPLCAEPDADLAAFRVVNGTEETVTVGWEVVGEGAGAPEITFPDCETVTVRGTFADVIPHVIWWDEEGLVGTISEPVGSVAGERTVNVDEFFGIDPAAGPVVESAEVFEEGTIAVPGGGDVYRENPEAQACRDAALAAVEDDAANESGDDAATERGDGRSERADEGERRGVLERATEGESTVPAGGSSVVLAHAPAGEATVGLFHRGEEIDAAESDPETRCRDVVRERIDEGALPESFDREELLAALDEHELPAEVDEKALRKAIHEADANDDEDGGLVETLRKWLRNRSDS